MSCASNSIPSSAEVQNVDYLITEGKRLWIKEYSSAFKKAEHFINLAYKQRENDFMLSVLYSQVSFARAYFFENDAKVQTQFFKGSQSSKRAVINHEDFIPFTIHQKVIVLLIIISNSRCTTICGSYLYCGVLI